MKELKGQLSALQTLVDSYERGEELAHYFAENYEIPFEPDNQEFWEYNYEI